MTVIQEKRFEAVLARVPGKIEPDHSDIFLPTSAAYAGRFGASFLRPFSNLLVIRQGMGRMLGLGGHLDPPAVLDANRWPLKKYRVSNKLPGSLIQDSLSNLPCVGGFA